MEAIASRQLAAYMAVARAANFTAAAAEMHVSQSSLSRAVADLERQLGVLGGVRSAASLTASTTSAIDRTVG